MTDAVPVSVDAMLRVYCLTDDRIVEPSQLPEVVQAALDGATALQYRVKRLSVRRALAQGRVLRQLASEHGVPFIVNDRVDLALALSADGVHIGQDDLPAAAARGLIGDDPVLGVSADTVEDARAAERDGADYLGVGPVFPTETKADPGEVLGPDGLAAITAAVEVPVVGIGGITQANAAQVVDAGASGVAVVSAVMGADDPGAAADALRQVVDA